MIKYIAGIIVGLMLITGCSSSPEDKAADSSGGTTTKAEAIDTVFVSMVRDDIPALDPVDDDTLVSTGEQICDLYDGQTLTEGLLMAGITGFQKGAGGYMTFNDTAKLFGLSFGAYCPEVGEQLQSLSDVG